MFIITRRQQFKCSVLVFFGWTYRRQVCNATQRIKQVLHDGIDYLPTRTEDNTNMTHTNDDSIITPNNVHYLNVNGGGKTVSEHQRCEPIRIVPHPRTLLKAREQVKYMVIDGISFCRIRNYLHRWVMWWTTTSTTWQYQALLQHFIDVCWHEQVAAYATALSCYHLKASHTQVVDVVGTGTA